MAAWLESPCDPRKERPQKEWISAETVEKVEQRSTTEQRPKEGIKLKVAAQVCYVCESSQAGDECKRGTKRTTLTIWQKEAEAALQGKEI